MNGRTEVPESFLDIQDGVNLVQEDLLMNESQDDTEECDLNSDDISCMEEESECEDFIPNDENDVGLKVDFVPSQGLDKEGVDRLKVSIQMFL